MLVLVYCTANQCDIIRIQGAFRYRANSVGDVARLDGRAILKNEIRFACTLQSALNHLRLLQ